MRESEVADDQGWLLEGTVWAEEVKDPPGALAVNGVERIFPGCQFFEDWIQEETFLICKGDRWFVQVDNPSRCFGFFQRY